VLGKDILREPVSGIRRGLLASNEATAREAGHLFAVAAVVN
jgi:hypothetical protein